MNPRERYDSLFQFYAEAHQAGDWTAMKAQGLAESGLASQAVSPAGAAGVMQFMLPTWVEWHGRIHPSEAILPRSDPERSIDLGCAYMAWLQRRFRGHPPAARAAYNWGVGNLERSGALEIVGYRVTLTRERLPGETQRYLDRIERIHHQLRRSLP